MTLTSAERDLLGGLPLPPLAPGPQLALGREIAFSVGPDVAPIDAMERAVATVRRMLPMLLKEAPVALAVSEEVLAVTRELVDIAARDRSSVDILGRVTLDDAHITISVGEKRCPLPRPDVEPGLYLVHRLAEEVGQYRGDGNGYIMWAAVGIQRNDDR
ncbi:hypothetical protein AB0C52_12680 [Streptomyces sp. NPDC048717]|uniref:hypothetical protein n=1 Tax=Streptomyces sp. NPDC048717 TaxID=3154928 RepID=UPI0034400E44